jgi:hypothetical protein
MTVDNQPRTINAPPARRSANAAYRRAGASGHGRGVGAVIAILSSKGEPADRRDWTIHRVRIACFPSSQATQSVTGAARRGTTLPMRVRHRPCVWTEQYSDSPCVATTKQERRGCFLYMAYGLRRRHGVSEACLQEAKLLHSCWSPLSGGRRVLSDLGSRSGVQPYSGSC